MITNPLHHLSTCTYVPVSAHRMFVLKDVLSVVLLFGVTDLFEHVVGPTSKLKWESIQARTSIDHVCILSRWHCGRV